MDFIKFFIELVMHLDKHLAVLTRDYGVWTYLILFLIVFCETGLVVTPLLPGDSLLFAAGNIAALGSIRVDLLFAILSVAAVSGDTVNYWAGNIIGPRVFRANGRFLKKEYLDRTHLFYEKYGGKTVILARFVPIVRTFAPFVAGVGSMSYGRFFAYNILGGVSWIALFVLSGYYFGALPVVKQNFSIVILAIIIISILPAALEFIRHRNEPAD